MHHIIYLSRAVVPFSDARLNALLMQARDRNAVLGITGFLVYGNEQFLQVLEGEESVVRALYASIQSDPRHCDVLAYADKRIDARAFDGWEMAFQAAAPERMEHVAGYVPLEDWSLDGVDLSGVDYQLLTLLRAFVLPAPER